MYSIINYGENKDVKIDKKFQPEITIIKVDCMQYIAQIIKDELIEMGWICSIISHENMNEYIEKNNPHHYFLFFITTQITKNVAMYKRYILYQLEQNVNNKISVNYNKLHESNILRQMYNNASLLIDYCELNVKVTKQYYKNDFKIMNVPARNITHTESHKEDYTYDIIFIGSMNKRRENILNKLKEKYKLLIVENVYGEELKQLCNQSNICLNIHYYENAILERVRLNEMMEYGIKIISEKPCDEDMDICKYYNSIHFIDMIDQLDELINTIEYIKNIEIKHNLKKLNSIFKKDIEIINKLNKNLLSSYRLGDLVLIGLNKNEIDELIQDHPNTIGYEYVKNGYSLKNMDKLKNIVKNYIIKNIKYIPHDIRNSTVIHLRLGDVMCGNFLHEKEKRPFTIEEINNKISKDRSDKIYIIGKKFFAKPSSTNYNECIEYSNKYLNDVIEYFHATHIQYNADLDLCCAVLAKNFVEGKGYYSKLIIEIRNIIDK